MHVATEPHCLEPNPRASLQFFPELRLGMRYATCAQRWLTQTVLKNSRGGSKHSNKRLTDFEGTSVS